VRHFGRLRCIIHSSLIWCKNYRNQLIFAKFVAKSSRPRFLCPRVYKQFQFLSFLLLYSFLFNTTVTVAQLRWSLIYIYYWPSTKVPDFPRFPRSVGSVNQSKSDAWEVIKIKPEFTTSTSDYEKVAQFMTTKTRSNQCTYCVAVKKCVV